MLPHSRWVMVSAEMLKVLQDVQGPVWVRVIEADDAVLEMFFYTSDPREEEDDDRERDDRAADEG
jgi:hypothetical protein